MEKHFLDDYVEGQSVFDPKPLYNLDGDCIVYKTTNVAVVADRIDEILTVYRSAEDDSPVGFQIKGVKALVGKFGCDGLAIGANEENGCINQVSLTAVLFAAYEEGPTTIGRRTAYAAVARSTPSECDSLCLQ